MNASVTLAALDLAGDIKELGETALRIKEQRDDLRKALDRLVSLIECAAEDDIVIGSKHPAVHHALTLLKDAS